MPELIEEQESPQFDPEWYLNLIRRRHVYFLVPLLLGWLLVWGASWVLPAKYKSSTLILVEEPQMPASYVAPNVNENLQDRLQSITQQILSRTRLLTIIDKLNLYSDKSYKTPDDKVDAMRKDIGPVEIVKDAKKNEVSSFIVSYSAKNPLIAQQVTTELTELFIDENSRVRADQSAATTRFMEQQLEDARVALAVQEAKMKQFDAAHEGALPSQQQSNIQILAGLQSQLQNQQDALNTAKQQRVYYQSLIDQYKSAQATGNSPDAANTELGALNKQVEKLRTQLTDLTAHYTDSYPDVVRTKAQIAALERQKAALLAAPKNDSDGSGENQTGPMFQLQSQLKANELEIQSRERGISGLEQRIGEYQARLNAQPATEQELLEVSRGYEQSKAIYDDLLKKKTQSEMATSMEQLQKGERFTMLDPPSLPLKPDFPNRLKFCGMGVGVGFALGCLVVFLMEFFDDRMHGEKEIKGPVQEQKQKREVVRGWALTAAVCLVIAAGSTYSFIRG